MNMTDHSAKHFFDALDKSFLSVEEKQELRSLAEKGVTEETWNELNDRLIASLVSRGKQQRDVTEVLDREIQRFSAEYEQDKTKVDRQMWDALAKLKEDDIEGRRKLWADYERDIDKLQKDLLASVRSTSTTVLHDVILQVAALEA